ncbi:unnamed protein product [Durusdinium trenchii]|uniref:Uncharacterized protein n=1 Tax=Durusdinium trenchii TaxID=1381693 RepID=A0ABP0PBH9_9DINO
MSHQVAPAPNLMSQRDDPVIVRTTLVDPVCFLVLKILVQGHELQQVRHDNVLDPMEIALKYFVMTELFVCNFVCRCFFWEESNLDMQDLAGIKALIVLESEDLIVPTYSVRSLIFAEQSRRAKVTGLNPSETGLEVHWVEDQPHAGFLLDMVLRAWNMFAWYRSVSWF